MFRSHTADYSLGASGAARGMEMQNLTVGVIGTGRIGKALFTICPALAAALSRMTRTRPRK